MNDELYKRTKRTRFSKVTELPFVFGILTKETIERIRREVPGQPNNMDYRREFIKGRGASTKDPTWKRTEHLHKCCRSKVPWRHKASCHKVLKDHHDLSDLL